VFRTDPKDKKVLILTHFPSEQLNCKASKATSYQPDFIFIFIFALIVINLELFMRNKVDKTQQAMENSTFYKYCESFRSSSKDLTQLFFYFTAPRFICKFEKNHLNDPFTNCYLKLT